MVSGIVRRLENMGENDIQSQTIGRLVMEALKALDDVAYVRFAFGLQDFRGAKDFEASARRACRRGDRRRNRFRRRLASRRFNGS